MNDGGIVRPLRKGDLEEENIPPPPHISGWRAVRSVFIGIVLLVGIFIILHRIGGTSIAAAFLMGWALHGLVVQR